MGYSQQQEDYMRIIETKNEYLEKKIKELKAENISLKKKFCPSDSNDYARLRKQTQELQKKYKNAQKTIEDLRTEIEKLKSQIIYRVNK